MASDFWDNYDTVYAGKDYAGEVATILPLLKSPKTLLDVGCGTGTHALIFAQHGIDVTAIDYDEEAISVARNKDRNSSVKFQVCLPQRLRTDALFDAAVSLFDVVNYRQSTWFLYTFFAGIFDHIKPGAKFVFDCWNGDAALNDPPRVKVTKFGTITPTLAPSQNLETTCVHLRFDATVEGNEFTYEFDHYLWSIDVLRRTLEDVGFANVLCTSWMMPEREASAQDWKVMFVCEKPQ